MAGIGELSVSVTARTQKAIKNIRSFRNSVNALPSVIKRAATSMGGIATAAAGLVGVASIGSEIKKSFDNIDQLAKTSDKIGIATDRLAGLRLAAEETGVASSTLDMALQRMVRRVSEAAKGSGEAKDALAELGLNARQLNSLSPDEQFRQIATAMGSVGNQSDKVRLAMRLFDSEGVSLVNTLKLGRDGLDDYQNSAEKLGLAVSRFDAAQIEKANNAFGRIGKFVEGLTNQIAIGLAPVVEGLSKQFVSTGSQISVTSDGVIDVLRNVGKVVGFVADGVGFWIRAFKSVRAYLTEFFAWYTDVVARGNIVMADLASQIPGIEVKASQFAINLASEMRKAAEEARASADEAWSKPFASRSIDNWFGALKSNISEARKLAEKENITKPLFQMNATGIGEMFGNLVGGLGKRLYESTGPLADFLNRKHAGPRANPGILNARSAEGYAALRSSVNGTGVQQKILATQKEGTKETKKTNGILTQMLAKLGNAPEVIGFNAS